MKHISKRLAALMLSLALVLAALPVGAQTHQPEESSVLQSEYRLHIDPALFTKLMGELSGPEGQADAGASALDPIVAAVNRMKLTLLSAQDLLTLDIGTEAGQIVDLQVVADPATAHALITTNLLPGAAIEVPQQLLNDFAKALPSLDDVVSSQIQAADYVAAVQQYFQENAPANLQQEKGGSFDVPQAGVFANRTSFDLDLKLMLGMTTALLEVLKQDGQVQEYINLYLATSSGNQERAATAQEPGADAVPETAVHNAAELIQQMEESIQKAQAEENRTLGKAILYETADGLGHFVQLELADPKDAPSRTLISLLARGDTNGVDAFSRMEVLTDVGSQAPADGARPSWDVIKAAVLDRSNPDDLLVQADNQIALEAAHQMLLHTASISIHSGKGMVAISHNGTYGTDDPHKASGSFSLALNEADPILTLHYDRVQLEAGSVPALPSLEGVTVVPFGDGVSRQEDVSLTEILISKGLPTLFDNLMKALPEEADALNAFFNGEGQEAPQP